jgi:hypothetical protein
LSPKADVYSFAVLALEFLSGKIVPRPSSVRSDTATAAGIDKHLSYLADAFGKNVAIPYLKRCLLFRPEERPPMIEVHRALKLSLQRYLLQSLLNADASFLDTQC